jgi:ATP-binding cassette subfamily F protein 3
VSQQSRFHSQKLESLSKDIDLKGVKLSVGNKELLSDAELKLLSGVHYGLIGRNGVGKSSLLKSIGYGNLVGLPQNVKALYVDQLESTDVEARVVDVVMESNRALKAAEKEAKLLSDAIENGDPETVLGVYRRVKLDRLVSEREEAQKVATKRSGQRGLEARAALIELEAKEKEARRELERGGADISEAERAKAMMSAQEMLTSAFEQLELLDAGSAEGEARKILRGLGFKVEKQDGPLRLLSGWSIQSAILFDY